MFGTVQSPKSLRLLSCSLISFFNLFPISKVRLIHRPESLNSNKRRRSLNYTLKTEVVTMYRAIEVFPSFQNFNPTGKFKLVGFPINIEINWLNSINLQQELSMMVLRKECLNRMACQHSHFMELLLVLASFNSL